MEYTPVIGLEIHAELRTTAKMFCLCRNDPDENRPNWNVCPICLGHPGTLPVLNRKAIEHVFRIGAAVDGTLADFTEWDRKNYFYPDIPKGYQISQYKYPLVSGGELAGVALERIHLEEDTARSTHDQHEKSLVDFNRSGVPLMELVTKPVIHNAATAVRFAKELQLLLRALRAGDANLEKGEMRVEANISVSDRSQTANGKFGTKTEVKNLNSFRSVEKAIEHEIKRQTSLLEGGGVVAQETRGWDDSRGETYSQRSKENSHDYRYFPDPDIPKMKISEIPEFKAAALRKDMPELPWAKRERLKRDYSMTDKEVAVFVEHEFLSDYFDLVLKFIGMEKKTIRLLINYLLTDYVALLKSSSDLTGQRRQFRLDPLYIEPNYFAELIQMISKGEVSSSGGKNILALLVDKKGVAPSVLAEKHGLLQKNDAVHIEPAVDKVIADNARVVAEYRAGKVASLQFLIGQTMKATGGAANPAVISKLLLEKLAD